MIESRRAGSFNHIEISGDMTRRGRIQGHELADIPPPFPLRSPRKSAASPTPSRQTFLQLRVSSHPSRHSRAHRCNIHRVLLSLNTPIPISRGHNADRQSHQELPTKRYDAPEFTRLVATSQTPRKTPVFSKWQIIMDTSVHSV